MASFDDVSHIVLLLSLHFKLRITLLSLLKELLQFYSSISSKKEDIWFFDYVLKKDSSL